MFPGFVLQHGILRQIATVAIPGHVFPQIQNVSRLDHRPITVCILQWVVSANLQLVLWHVLYILPSRNIGMSAAHAVGGKHSSTPCACLFSSYGFLPASFTLICLGTILATILERLFSSLDCLSQFRTVVTSFLHLPHNPATMWQRLLSHMSSLEQFLPEGPLA